jgi:hypothetical protein
MYLIYLLTLLGLAFAAQAEIPPAPVPMETPLPVAPTPAPAAQEPPQEYFFDLWKNAYPKLAETLELKDRHESLPDSAWFGRDKKRNARDINALLQKVLEILGFSEVQANIEEIQKTRVKISKLREDIGKQQTRAVGDPANAVKYAAKITELRASVSAHERAIEETKNQILAQLLQLGLQVNREQVEILLAGVSGTDIVQMSVVFNNVKLFSNQLARLMQENREDLGFARKHYGMYAILIELLIIMQQQFIDEVEQVYLPGVAKIAQSTQALQEETQALLGFETAEHRRLALQQSLASQRLSLQTVALYRQLLERQQQQVHAAQQTLRRDLEVAMIRYHTVKLSGDLVDLIQAGNHQFHALANLQLPELTPFQGQQIKAEFEKLTAELQGLER